MKRFNNRPCVFAKDVRVTALVKERERRFGESITKTIKSFRTFHLTQRVNLSAPYAILAKDNKYLLHFLLMLVLGREISLVRSCHNWIAFEGGALLVGLDESATFTRDTTPSSVISSDSRMPLNKAEQK